MAKAEAYMEGVHYEELPVSGGQLRHPPGLKVLFLTEMWERFSFYGMRALLVLYVIKALHYRQDQALMLYGIYTGLIYVTPVLGGYIADRWIGARKGLFVGCLIMMFGHFAMIFDAWLYYALGLLIVGSGFFKPNASLLVGRLYSEENAILVPAGYTIFYMGINVGALLSPLIAGTIGEHWSWSYGFAVAGVGMLIAFCTLLWGQKRLGSVGLPQGQDALISRDWVHIILLTLASIPFVGILFLFWESIRYVWHATARFGHFFLGVSIFIVTFTVPFFFRRNHRLVHLSSAEWRQIFILGISLLFVIFFWVGFEQAGGRINLFIDEYVNRKAFGLQIPTTWFQAINPIFIVILAPIMAWLWRYGFWISDIMKQALGLLALALGFVVMGLAAHKAFFDGSKVSPFWLFGVFFFNSLGELLVSPTGLSLFSKLSPLRFASMLMGMWFVASGIASSLAGIVGARFTEHSQIYFFWIMAYISGGAGLILLTCSPWLNRLTGESLRNVSSGNLPLEGPGPMSGRTEATDLVD